MNLYEDMNIYEAMELLNEDIKFADNKWNKEFNELEKAIKKADRIFLFRHIKPDQDALSSVTAWKIMLTKKYPKKEISIATEHSLFGNLTTNDLVIINDLGQDDRIAGKWSGNPVIARIDHHETGRQYNITIEDIEAGSTCELLTIYFNTMKYDLDKTTAELLFKGIITDTGRMQYSLSETTLIALSILRKIGVDYKRIYAQLYMQSNETIRSKKYILSKYLTSPNGVAYLYITPKEANSARIDINSTSSMVYELENIKGCPIWLIASERPDGVYIRLRSRDIDIRPIANLYGGGGHPNACGLKISKNEFPKLIDALDSLLVKKKIKLVEEAGKTEESDTVEKEEYQLKYDEYLKTHISCVQQAYDYIKENLPDIINEVEELGVLDEQILHHDESKYSEEEYEPYALYFNVSKEKYLDEFNKAWNHHQKSNPHHWNYWVLIEDEEDQKYVPIEMPINYIVEMICDWWAFSFKAGKLDEILTWYDEHKDKMLLHPETKKTVERFINLIKDHLAGKEYPLDESRLPADGSDPQFGLPDKKKYPLFDESHVRSAIKFFNYADPEDRLKLARAIHAKMKEYNISSTSIGEGNKLKEYLTEVVSMLNTELELQDSKLTEAIDKLPTQTKRSIYKLRTSLVNKYGTAAANYALRRVREGNLEDLDDVQRKIDLLISNKGYDPETGKRIPIKTSAIKSLKESVLDPINKERCPDIFKNDKMIPTVRKFILEMISDFKKQINFPFEIKSILMIGSSTGYQYSLTSDIDIEVETDIPENKKWEIIKIIPKGTFLPDTHRPINMFLLTNNEKYDLKNAENAYDIKTNEWIKQSEKSDYHIPYQYIKDLSRFFMNGCDLTLSHFEQDKKEMEEYLALDPKTQEISENEKAEAIDRKINDLKNDIDSITMAHHVIFAFEQEGYNDMPFRLRIEMEKNDDPRYSVNNLVYKMVDRFGYFDKLNDAKKEAQELIKRALKWK